MVEQQSYAKVVKGSTSALIHLIDPKKKKSMIWVDGDASYLDYQLKELQSPSATYAIFSDVDRRIVELEKKMVQLDQKVDQISEELPKIVNASISSLPSEKYEIKTPISVILKIYIDETLALFPELELYGEGKNEIEALNDLKLELIDLMEDLEEIPEDKMGKNPKSWKKALNKLIKQCQ